MLWFIAAATAQSLVAPSGLDTGHVATEPQPTTTGAVGIYQGRPEPQLYPEVVGLGVLGITVCSGTLITPRLVLTAAHCAVDLPESIVTSVGSAFFGATPDTSEAVGLEALWTHPDYVRLDTAAASYTLGEADVALVLLSDDAPVRPVWFRTTPFSEGEVLGATVVSVGWGEAEDGSSYAKRSAELTLDELDPWFLVSKASTNVNSAAICSGDSGGPKLGEGPRGPEVWGVHSWASTSCKGESGSTRTDVVAPWILEQIEAVHGTTDRCEIHRAYDDGFCDDDCDHPDPDCARFARFEATAQLQPTSCSTSPRATFGLALALGALWVRRRSLHAPER